jgi:CHRD domain-containing protein
VRRSGRVTGIAVLLAGTLLMAMVSSQVAAQAAGSRVELRAHLTGKAQVEPGDPDGKGDATVTLDGRKGKVCFTLGWSGIDPPMAAHIHAGRKGRNGDVVVGLFKSDQPLPGTVQGIIGCVSGVDATLIGKIAHNPGAYYVNVHNTPYPNGAIRGQLHR